MSFKKSSVNTGAISHERIEVTKSLASEQARTLQTGSPFGANYQVTTSDSCQTSKNCHPENPPKIAPAFAGFHEGGADQTIIYYSNASPRGPEKDTFVPNGKYVPPFRCAKKSMYEPTSMSYKKNSQLFTKRRYISPDRANIDCDWRGQPLYQYEKMTDGHEKNEAASSEAFLHKKTPQIKGEKKFGWSADRDLSWRA